MALLAFYWGVMIICYIIASKLRHKKEKFNFLEQLLNLVIYVLVFIMGLRMGSNEEVIANLGTIGVQSVLATVMIVGGSIFAVLVTRIAMGLNKEGIPKVQAELETSNKKGNDENQEKDTAGMKTTLIILGFVAAGMISGYLIVPMFFDDLNVFQAMSSDWMVVGITVLLACVGFNLGLEGKVFSSLKQVGFKALLIPVAAVAGSLIMGAVYGLVSPLTVGEGIAISAGFGWYTMAPGLMVEAGFVVSGAISFMHNVIRETLGIIIIPLVAKKIGYLEAVSIPGVAAMDVCMPIVERSCRAETVVYSFCTGAFMCLFVPTVVPLALGI
ncbi:MAG: lysine exporter LysO family protein [Firmicutes bacterium]|nr:lysine exporter LysO family protein [Bacillota bacterium]